MRTLAPSGIAKRKNRRARKCYLCPDDPSTTPSIVAAVCAVMISWPSFSLCHNLPPTKCPIFNNKNQCQGKTCAIHFTDRENGQHVFKSVFCCCCTRSSVCVCVCVCVRACARSRARVCPPYNCMAIIY